MSEISMDPMDVVTTWDTSLRAGDWAAARSALAADAVYLGLDDDVTPMCDSGDAIVALMRSWKGTLPDVEVLEWKTIGDHVIATLRQPAWGEDAIWWQVLTTIDGVIVRLQDFGEERGALAAATPPT